MLECRTTLWVRGRTSEERLDCYILLFTRTLQEEQLASVRRVGTVTKVGVVVPEDFEGLNAEPLFKEQQQQQQQQGEQQQEGDVIASKRLNRH